MERHTGPAGSVVIGVNIPPGIHFHPNLSGIPQTRLLCIISPAVQIPDTPCCHRTGRIKFHPIGKQIIKYHVILTRVQFTVTLQKVFGLFAVHLVSVISGQTVIHHHTVTGRIVGAHRRLGCLCVGCEAGQLFAVVITQKETAIQTPGYICKLIASIYLVAFIIQFSRILIRLQRCIPVRTVTA